MARRSRQTSTFSLSFLDIMSCGLGAAVLIFLLLKHVVDGPTETTSPQTLSEVSLLEEEILIGEEKLARIRNTISDVSDETVVAQGLARQIQEDIDELQSLLDEVDSTTPVTSEGLRARIAKLERQKSALEQAVPAGTKAYEFSGDGERQYLTGLRMNGRNVLILLDASASMLDETIVNVVRRRSLPPEFRQQSPKWVRAKAIAQWIIANLPLQSDFQILAFNETTKTVTDDDIDTWYEVSDRLSVARAVQGLQSVLPEQGTNLQQVFALADDLRPRPDNIFLITDGLPTLAQGKPTKGSISGRERLSVFYESLAQLPAGIPVNTILLPLEGDPYAAASFWQLAQSTRGSFITPARDWP